MQFTPSNTVKITSVKVEICILFPIPTSTFTQITPHSTPQHPPNSQIHHEVVERRKKKQERVIESTTERNESMNECTKKSVTVPVVRDRDKVKYAKSKSKRKRKDKWPDRMVTQKASQSCTLRGIPKTPCPISSCCIPTFFTVFFRNKKYSLSFFFASTWPHILKLAVFAVSRTRLLSLWNRSCVEY